MTTAVKCDGFFPEEVGERRSVLRPGVDACTLTLFVCTCVKVY